MTPLAKRLAAAERGSAPNSRFSEFEIQQLQYAVRNNGRNFVTAIEDEPNNVAIDRLTVAGLFTDGGPSASGRWRVLTAAGLALAAIEQEPDQ